ncbi:MAG: hypothetical protein E7192_00355 [Erysipelotrichaceae bacterium]|nr:hypothetical protein [Erysipelotrichaceae bacterium]
MKKTNKNVDKREAHIKKKLSAAILMLLISCIMCVTSTYAWFTLSTAPEITGVSTTVGANGSLEIALSKLDGTEPAISAANDGTLALKEKNLTWGNQVDLSDTSYGLSNVILYPAALNVTHTTVNNAETSTIDKTYILKTPVYGPDGRVSSLTENTFTGAFNTTNSSFNQNNAERGVRAIGTVSGMSSRQLAYRTALANITSNKSSALSTVKQSFSNNGSPLAVLAVKYVATAEKTVVKGSEVNEMRDLVNDMQSILNNIEKGMLNAFDALLASKVYDETTGQDGDLGTVTETDYLIAHAAIQGDSFTINNFTVSGDKVTFSAEQKSFEITNPQFVSLITEYKDMVNKVSEVDGQLDTLYTNAVAAGKAANNSFNENAEFSWGEISNIFNKLVMTSAVTVNGYSTTEAKENIFSIASQGITVQLNDGSGIYYDFSEFIGNYQSSVAIPDGTTIVYGSLSLNMNGATVYITTTYAGEAKLDTMKAVASSAGEPSGTASNASITDEYGYVIDFYVRTNAADSYLLLSEARNRIYENGSETTMGSGSSMTFTAADNFADTSSVINLMKAIRVVFVQETADNYQVLAFARLNEGAGSYEGAGNIHKMNLQLCDKDGNLLYTGTDTQNQTPENRIMKLNQNTPTKISVIVYLDGAHLDNGDVANAVESLRGTMNLQFASSANLIPMNYTEYQQNTSGQVTKTPLLAPTFASIAGNKYTFTNPNTTGTTKLVYYVTDTADEVASPTTSDYVDTGVEATADQYIHIWAVPTGTTVDTHSNSTILVYQAQ